MPEHNFQITDNAVNRVSHLLASENQPGLKLRISVLGGGCSGFQYKYEFDKNLGEDDIVFGSVVIDEMSLGLIEGSMLDYVEDLGSAGFEIKNPKATARCGCGNSFSI
jgi:iron-sulfur cluster insertion protein